MNLRQSGASDEIPFLTVIVPVYNAEKWIPEALNTLEMQTYTAWKAIMVDDGSTDSSLSLLRAASESDSRIEVISQSNSGQAAARNIALGHVVTPWVTFLDIDDLLHPQCFELLMGEALRSGPDAIVRCGWYESKEPPKDIFLKIQNPRISIYTSEEAMDHLLYQSLPLSSAWAGVYPSRLFFQDEKNGEENGIRFIDGLFYEDLEIVSRLIPSVKQLIFIDAPLYFYRQVKGSFIHTFSPRRFDVLRVTDSILTRMEQTSPRHVAGARDRWFSARFNIFLLISRYDRNGEYEKIRRDCWKAIRSGRVNELRDPKVRMKNKLGALLSFLGKRTIAALSHLLTL